jgi:hypothetical protein
VEISGEIVYKVCGRCKENKSLDCFYLQKNKANGYQYMCKICCKLHRKTHYKANKETTLIKRKEYVARNKYSIANWHKNYRKENRSKFSESSAKRRAAKLNAVPKWLTDTELNQIREFYICAQMFKLYTGEEYHVDHIVPLQGENVCGLHVPWNLQVIPAKENLSKSNKLQEDIL